MPKNTECHDVYDREIETILGLDGQERVHLIQAMWENGETLFDIAGPRCCGCLTQIRDGIYDGATPMLTALIRADERIPCNREEIEASQLPVFAQWQRIIDRLGVRSHDAVARRGDLIDNAIRTGLYLAKTMP